MNPAGRPVSNAPLPSNEVAVITPVTLSAFVTVITPTVVSPLMFTAAVNVAAVPVTILSVDATPVRPSPDPTNDVAVIIPAPASTPETLIVTAAPTIAPVSYTHLRAHET